ncbi:adenylate/guanylate cyclase domain-containing protein [Thalassobaculum sp.]|uniref:AAA family ATPase n=1 Tax=Thalassobaculum sp. TaxID=2022740 RepID=UPI0032EBF39C
MAESFYRDLDRIAELLRTRGRVSYRALKRELGVDDELLADLAAELISVQRLAVEVDGGVLEWAGTAVAPGGAERRQVTVMFCDLVGSTGLAERLDPEDLRDLLRRYQETVNAIVRQCGGIVARYVGDGLLVYFGYPRAHEDDAARAVRAGLQIVEAVRGLPSAEPLQVRIGVHTGMAVLGDIGSGDSRESMAAVGETPNIAGRLQGLAEPDAVVLSDATHQLLRGAYECSWLGTQRLRGITGTVDAYRALRERPPWEMHEAANASEATPLVGRTREIALLSQYWDLAASGQGQVVLLRGEPGIGKSRLVRAIAARIAGQPHVRLKARGTEFHRNSAFHPVAELLHRALRFDDAGLPGPERFERLRARLTTHGLPGDDAAALLAPLLDIPLPDGVGPRRARTPERVREDTIAALQGFVLALASERPLILIVEDLHWIDASTLEWLDRLVDATAEHRMLVVLTARPEFGPRWTDRPGVHALSLARLGRNAAERIVTAVAGRSLPGAIVAEIANRTDGVPLFVEELTKMLLDAGLVPEQASAGSSPPALPQSIPASLQDSLIARLDRLPSGKLTAQISSVIGRRFSYAMLRQVALLDDTDLRRDLAALVDAELLLRHGEPPDAVYTFRHALVQDAAYQMLLRGPRRDYHERIALVLEERPGTAPEVLAHHFARAEDAAAAIRYWQQAGEEASRRLAYVEAISHFDAAIRLLPDLPEAIERQHRELALRAAMGVPLVAAKGYGSPEAEDCYTRAYDLSHELADRARLFPAIRGLWNLRLVRAELGRARELSGQLLDLAGRDGDPGKLVAAHRAVGVTLFKSGEYAAAAENFRRAIAAYDPGLHAALAPEHGADPCVVCLAYLGTATWALGHPDQALGHIEEALALARRLGHDLSVAVALTTASRFHQVRREPARVREHATAVIALSQELGLPYWRALGLTLLGWAMAHEGDAGGGIVAIQRGRKALRDTGAGLIEPWNLAALADAHRLAGEPVAALGLLSEALELAEATGERWWQAELHRLTGACTIERGGTDAEAADCFRRALDVARHQQARSLELRAATSLVRLTAGEAERALLAELLGSFTEGFDTPDLAEARALLDTRR